MKEELDYNLILEELKVINNRIEALRNLVVKKIEEETKSRVASFNKVVKK